MNGLTLIGSQPHDLMAAASVLCYAASVAVVVWALHLWVSK